MWLKWIVINDVTLCGSGIELECHEVHCGSGIKLKCHEVLCGSGIKLEGHEVHCGSGIELECHEVCITPSVVVRDYSLGSGVHTHLEVVCV